MKKEQATKSKFSINSTVQFINNAVRSLFLRTLTEEKRDLEEQCGHPETIEIEHYRYRFDRGDISTRIVRLYPEGCWSTAPLIYETEDETETEFERRWNALNESLRLNSVLLRADVLSGIGRFGIILLGLDDGQPLHTEVKPGEKRKLLYIRTFDESLVKIKQLEKNPSNPRFGQPVSYEIKFWNDNAESGSASQHVAPRTVSGIDTSPTPGLESRTTLEVHYTRVIHLADNRLTDDVFGTPRLQSVFNRLLDLHKIAGSSAEMFYKGGFPGLAIETTPDPQTGEIPELDKEATKEEMELYFEGLQRYIALRGASAKSLQPQAVDPEPHAELQIRLMAIAVNCPWRILMGAEVGQLASGQDVKAWNNNLNRRREEYVSPYVIRPFIDRLIMLGVLPSPSGGEDAVPERNGDPAKPKYIIWWDDLNTPSDDEKADVAEKRTNAMAKYVGAGVATLIPPEHYLELVAGFSKDEVEAIMEEAEEQDFGDPMPQAPRDPNIEDADLEEDVRADDLNS